MNSSSLISIVVIDDHQMFLDGITSVLSSQDNFEVLFVENNPQKALTKLKNNMPDLIITDISMPEMNGIEFVKIINKEYPSTKIIVLSMFDDLQSIQGIDAYLLKETDKKELVEVINKVVLENIKYNLGHKNKNQVYDFNKSILTPREKEIIQLIYKEFTTHQISDKLNVSIGTIETHRRNIFLKLQVKNITGLIKKAIYLGLTK